MTVNALLIELIEETPDTLVTLTTGKKMVVRERAQELAILVRDFYRSIGIAGTTKGGAMGGQTE